MSVFLNLSKLFCPQDKSEKAKRWKRISPQINSEMYLKQYKL